MHQLLPDAARSGRGAPPLQALSLAGLPAQEEKGRQGLLNSLAMHAARAFADPRSEIAKDRWDLTVLGHHGWLDFTRITQEWLRESVKAWAAHDLPKRRGRQAGARGACVRFSVRGACEEADGHPGSPASATSPRTPSAPRSQLRFGRPLAWARPTRRRRPR